MAEQKAPLRVEISYRTVIFTVTFLIVLWFLLVIKEIIILIFLSIIFLATLLQPVEWLSARRIPRVLAVLIVYILVIALIALSIGIIVPPLVSETSDLISTLPQIVATINDFILFHQIPVEDFSTTIASQLQQVGGNLIKISTTVFSSIFSFLTVFVLTFYLLLEWKSFVKLMASPFSGRQEKKVTNIVAKVESGLGRWVRGQLALSLVVGALTYIGLKILGVPYALPLSLVAGIFEIIPLVGPIISAIPAILVALTVTPILGLAVAALFLIIQQLENNLLVPMVMSRAVGLQPPFIIIAFLIGVKLAGIGGAFLAVPVIVVAKIVIKELLAEEEQLEEDLVEE